MRLYFSVHLAVGIIIVRKRLSFLEHWREKHLSVLLGGAEGNFVPLRGNHVIYFERVAYVAKETVSLL